MPHSAIELNWIKWREKKINKIKINKKSKDIEQNDILAIPKLNNVAQSYSNVLKEEENKEKK